MTRGTAFALLGNGKILSSCEFNGDMYDCNGTGHMRSMVSKLLEVDSSETFKKKITEFDLEHFEYQTENGDYFTFYERILEEVGFVGVKGQIPKTAEIDWSKWVSGELILTIDLRERMYYKKFFSDYLYFVNLSGEDYGFRTYDQHESDINPDFVLGDRQVAVFNFGKACRLFDRENGLLWTNNGE